MEKVGILYGHFEYIKALWYIYTLYTKMDNYLQVSALVHGIAYIVMLNMCRYIYEYGVW
jgi:hypothetical protein